MKLLIPAFLLLLASACSSPKPSDDRAEKDSIPQTDASRVSTSEPENTTTEPDVPVGSTDEHQRILDLLMASAWEEQMEDGEERFPLDFKVSYEDGKYYFRGLTEDYYLKAIQVQPNGDARLVFNDGFSQSDVCHYLVIHEEQLIRLISDDCESVSDREGTYYVWKDSNTGEKSMVAKWKSVNNYQGDLNYEFEKEDGTSVYFGTIEMDGFDPYDNPYIESYEIEESMFPLFKIRDDAEGEWYKITYIRDLRYIDLAGEEDTVTIITNIQEVH